MIQLRRSTREVYRVYTEDDFFEAHSFGDEGDMFASPADEFFDSASLAEVRALSKPAISERRLLRVAGVAFLAGALGTVGWVTTVGGVSRAGATGRTMRGGHAGGRRFLARQVLRTPASLAAVPPFGPQRARFRGESARATRHRATRHRVTRHRGTRDRRVDQTPAAGHAELPTISAPSTGISAAGPSTRPQYQEFGFER
jgi:hypothetical protein